MEETDFKKKRIASFYKTSSPDIYGLLKIYAKENRDNQTLAEQYLWSELSGNALGHSFRRQHIIGDYIADFVCLNKMLIIEIDGGYHEEYYQDAADEERTKVLEAYGCKVIRFTNEDVNRRFDEVCKTIESEIIQRIKNLPC